MGGPDPVTVLLASPRAFCAGVERAIETVERALGVHGAPVYVRKQIVHNTHVVADLAQRGARFVDELDDVPDGAVVVFSAHGVSPTVRHEARRRGLTVIDATCPLVAKVHAEARRFGARGDTVALIGHSGHEEVQGTLGQAPAATVLIETVADVPGLEVSDPRRVSYLTQTTLAVDETAEIVTALRDRFPALTGPDTDDICYATTNRQEAVAKVADAVDVVLVLGSANSSNSRRLVEIAERQGTTAHLIDDITAIDSRWLDNVGAIGITAGASAPERLVTDLLEYLRRRGPIVTREHVTTTESVHFEPSTTPRPPRSTR